MDYSKENNKKNKKSIKSRGKRAKNKVGIIVFRCFIAIFLIGGFAIVGVGLGAYLGIIENAPKLEDVQVDADESYTTIIYCAETGEEIARLDGGETREYAPSQRIPKELKEAFIAIEDERFYSHDGVDIRGFVRATYQTLFEDSKQGGSTITQQLIKNKLGIVRNTIDTKLQEQYLAIEFEKNLTEKFGSRAKAKDYILVTYLNSIALGSGQIGVQAAALRYFNKDVEDLTLDECVVIAAITQNPQGNNPIHFPASNALRATVCLNKMLELEFITQKQYDDTRKKVCVDELYEKKEITKEEYTLLKSSDVYSKISRNEAVVSEQPSFHTYYVDQIISEVSRDLREKYAMTAQEASNYIYNGGLTINAAIDLDMQAIVDEAYMNDELFPSIEYDVYVTGTISVYDSLTDVTTHHEYKGTVLNMESVDAFVEAEKEKLLGQNGKVVGVTTYASPQPQSAMVIMDYHTGQVKAIAGGRGPKLTNRGLNRATGSERQPGSVFKIMASYAPAIDMGLITPATVIDDIPYSYGKYSPSNWYGGYWGLSTVREGVIQSMNVITVKNMSNMGVDNAKNYLQNFKFTTLVDDDWQLATALGGITNGITQLEVTAAFGAIANGGMYNKPIFYTTVLDHAGDTKLENEVEPEQILKKTSAFLLTDMMKDAVTSGTGGQARFSKVKMPIAGKTGTTTDNKDLTFVGYTPYYVAGIWLGYDRPKPMHGNTKSDHLRLWRYIMEKIHEDLEPKEFERPDGITTAYICKESGQLADELCKSDPRGNTTRNEYFAMGTVPTEHCQVHKAFDVCIDSGKLPGEFCPETSIEHKVGIIRPVPYEGTANVADRIYEVPKEVLAEVVCDIHTTPVIDETGDPNSENPNMPDNPVNPNQTPTDFYLPTPGSAQTPAPNQNPTGSPVTPVMTPAPTPTPMPEVTRRPEESVKPTPSPVPEPPTMEDLSGGMLVIDLQR